MKTINNFINEGIFSSKIAVLKRLNKIGITDDIWSKLHVHGQSAVITLLDAIDYVGKNADQFGEYKDTTSAIRDAINNALEYRGHSKKLTIE